MIRERMTEILIAKQQARAEAEALVSQWLDGGGKVKRIACTGKSPRFGKHYCDPRERGALNNAMVQRPVRGVPCKMSMGESRLVTR